MTTNRWWDYVLQVGDGMTQKALADRSGIEQAAFSRWKTGRNRPRAEQVVQFARAFNRPPTEALIAAGYLTPDESGGQVTIAGSVRDLPTTTLLEELHRRTDPEPIRFSPKDSDVVQREKVARLRALLPDAFVDGTPDQDVMDAAFGEDPEYRAYRAQTRRTRRAYLHQHPDERLPDDPGQPWAGGLRAARHQTDPGQTIDDDVGGA